MAVKAYLITSRLQGAALWALDPEEAKLYFAFRAGDLAAALTLIDAAELMLRRSVSSSMLTESRVLQDTLVLRNAADYLRDREAYLAKAST